ncbi:MAG: SIMPL domain-containing protein [Paludibacter sp.]|nr:SIMPL domain-containing protein [Paludibacter sp.]
MKTKLIILSFLLLSSISLFSQVNGNLLKVKGESIIYATPEDMTINVSVTIKDPNYILCSDKLIEKYNSLVNELSRCGIDKKMIMTDGLEITENNTWSAEGRKFESYNGSVNVSIELKYDPKKLNILVNAIKNKDLALTYHVNFNLSKEQKEALVKESIEKAISDATNKAKIILEALGLKIIEIKDINFGEVSYGNDQLIYEEDHAYGAEIADLEERKTTHELWLSPQKMNIEKSIAIVWRIEK